MSKLLLDTNILVYAKDASSKFHAGSIAVMSGSDELYMTSKNLTEYYSVVTRGERPFLSPAEALEDLEEFYKVCVVLYPNDISYRQLSALVLSYRPTGILIHDIEIAAIALANGINHIATFNKDDFQFIKEIEVIIP